MLTLSQAVDYIAFPYQQRANKGLENTQTTVDGTANFETQAKFEVDVFAIQRMWPIFETGLQITIEQSKEKILPLHDDYLLHLIGAIRDNVRFTYMRYSDPDYRDHTHDPEAVLLDQAGLAIVDQYAQLYRLKTNEIVVIDQLFENLLENFLDGAVDVFLALAEVHIPVGKREKRSISEEDFIKMTCSNSFISAITKLALLHKRIVRTFLDALSLEAYKKKADRDKKVTYRKMDPNCFRLFETEGELILGISEDVVTLIKTMDFGDLKGNPPEEMHGCPAMKARAMKPFFVKMKELLRAHARPLIQINNI